MSEIVYTLKPESESEPKTIVLHRLHISIERNMDVEVSFDNGKTWEWFLSWFPGERLMRTANSRLIQQMGLVTNGNGQVEVT